MVSVTLPRVPRCSVPVRRPGRRVDPDLRGTEPGIRRADPGDTATLPPLQEYRPWPGREVTVGGVTLHVRETAGPAGEDVDAVYVHGLSGSATNWTDLAGLLAPRAHGVAVDLPGFGCSRPLPSCDYTPSGHADALLCFLAGRGRPVHLLGNSLGGMIAMLVAARRPELVRTLTLISPAMPDRRPDPRRMSDPRMALAMVPGIGSRARAQLAAATPRARAEQVVALCFGDPTRATESRLDEAAAELLARGRQPWAGEAVQRTALGIFATWAGRGLWTVAGRVRVPTLVIWGDRDRLVSPRLAVRTTRTFPDGRLLMLDGVGHVAQIEVPDRVAAAVAAFWDAAGAHSVTPHPGTGAGGRRSDAAGAGARSGTADAGAHSGTAAVPLPDGAGPGPGTAEGAPAPPSEITPDEVGRLGRTNALP